MQKVKVAEPEPEASRFGLSQDMTPEELEKLYYDVVLQQDFYGEEYTTNLTLDDAPSACIAEMIVTYFQPRKTLDVGCGLGMLVQHLRKRGVEAYGCDYSETFLRSAPEEVRKFLSQQDITDLRYQAEEFDFVSCMETLEHLPLRLIDMAIKQLKKVTKGPIFLTIPSYGPNPYGPYALPLFEANWYRDAHENRPFRNIVVNEHGIPHHGHLTLASYRWWTEKFLHHDLIRSPELELKINYDNSLNISRFRWNIYVLHKVKDSAIKFGDGCTGQLGTGWHSVERWANEIGYVRWTQREAETFLSASKSAIDLYVELYTGPRELVYDRWVRIVAAEKEGISYRVVGESQTKVAISRWETLKLRLEPSSATSPQDRRFIRVVLTVSETFIGDRIFGNSDNRELGVAVRSIRCS